MCCLPTSPGIALASDPNYKVLGAAYPWVARRLLTDDSPELRGTLRRLLYRKDGAFRFDRLEALLEQAVRSPRAPRRTDAPRGAILPLATRFWLCVCVASCERCSQAQGHPNCVACLVCVACARLSHVCRRRQIDLGIHVVSASTMVPTARVRIA